MSLFFIVYHLESINNRLKFDGNYLNFYLNKYTSTYV